MNNAKYQKPKKTWKKLKLDKKFTCFILTLLLLFNTYSSISSDRESLTHYLPSNYNQDGPDCIPTDQTFSIRRLQASSLRILHLNVRSIYSIERRAALHQILSAADDLDIDIIGLTETWLNGAAVESLQHDPAIRNRYRIRACTTYEPGDQSAPTAGRGSLLLIRSSLANHIGEIERIPGYGVMTTLHFRGCKLRVICLYAPTAPLGQGAEATVEVQRIVNTWLTEARRLEHKVILLGDLNGTFNPFLDRQNGQTAIPDSPLLACFQRNGMIDLWRMDHPNTRAYSHVRADTQARLDYILATDDLAVQSLGSCIGTDSLDTGSDHLPVLAEISGINVRIRLPRLQEMAPRLVLDQCQLEKEHWTEFRNLTDHVVDDFERSVARATIDLNQPAISAAWNTLIEGLLETADTCLPYRAITTRPANPRSVLCRQGKAVKLIRSLTHALAQVPRNHQHISRKIDRLRATIPDKTRTLELVDLLSIDCLHDLRADLLREISRLAKQRLLSRIRNLQDRRFEDYSKNLKRMIDGLLERRKPDSSLSFVMDPARIPVSDPTLVKETVSNFFTGWFQAQAHQDPLNDPVWAPLYAPIESIDASIYQNLMNPISVAEIEEALKCMGNGKSPGPSNVPTELYKYMSADLHEALASLFTAILTTGKQPLSWHHTQIYAISKGGDYCGDLNNLRPITLIDTGRKLFSKIVTERLSTIADAHNIFQGINYGSAKGVQALDAVHILQTTIENSTQYSQPLELVSLDIRRAFDSVPFDTQRASLRRLKIPEPYIDLVMDLCEQREVRVITAHGMSPAFRPSKGIEQGEINGPFMWIAAYDPLLTKLRQSAAGYQMVTPLGEPQLALHALSPLQPIPPVTLATETLLTPPARICVNNIAFMDDLTLIAASLAQLRELIEIVESFMNLHGIQLNARKTVHARNSPEVLDEPLLVEGVPVGTTLSRGEPFRVLGVWVSTHSHREGQIAQIQETSHNLARIIKPKLCTDKIARYIYRAVVLPKLAYMATGMCLTSAEVKSIEMPWRKILKNQSGLPSSIATSLLHSSLGYAIPCLASYLAQKDFADFQIWCNSASLVGDITRWQFRCIQMTLSYPCFPGNSPKWESYKWRRTSKYVHFLGALRTLNMRLHCDHPMFNKIHQYFHFTQPYLIDILPESVWKEARSRLERHNLFLLAQLRCFRGTRLRNHHELTGNRREDPLWYRNIADHLTTDGFTLQEDFRGISLTLTPQNEPVPAFRPPPLQLQRYVPAPMQQDVTPIRAFTDGSVDDTRSYSGFSCIFPDLGTHYLGSITDPRGFLSSTTAELGGLVLAIKHAPSNVSLTVITDSQSAMSAAVRAPRTLRTQLKEPNQDLLSLLRYLLVHRLAPIALEWTRGHAGNEENERADQLANEARVRGEPILTGPLITGTNHFRFYCNTSPLPSYGRSLVKQLYLYTHSQIFLSSSHGLLLRDLPSFDLIVTVKALQSASTYEPGLHTNRGNSTFRAFRFKLISRLLPTMSRQHIWRPDLYESANCLLCNQCVEDWDHIFLCPVLVTGHHSFHDRLREELANLLPPSRAADAHLMSDVLEQSGLTAHGFDGTPPTNLSLVLEQIPLRTTLHDACLAVVRALHRIVYYDFWKPRCEAVTAAELRLGITSFRKRQGAAQRPQAAEPAPDDLDPAEPAPAEPVPAEPAPAAPNGRTIPLGRSHASDCAIFSRNSVEIFCGVTF